MVNFTTHCIALLCNLHTRTEVLLYTGIDCYDIRNHIIHIVIHALSPTCAGVVIDPNEARQAVTAIGAREVHTHSVGMAVVHLGGALINIWGKKQIQQSVLFYHLH